MADIFDEIDEELKKDKAQLLWARYGKFVIVAVAAVILAVGSAQGFKAWKTKQVETAANAYQLAVDSDDVVASLRQAMADLTDGYEMLAQFRLAAAKAADGDSDGAVADYMMLAENEAIKPLYQEAALLLAVMNAPDGTDPRQSQDQLAPLTATPGPWQGLALEQSAALDLEKNDPAAALEKFESILDLAELSQELRQRASQLVTILKSAAE
jgi:hypothetical protein